MSPKPTALPSFDIGYASFVGSTAEPSAGDENTPDASGIRGAVCQIVVRTKPSPQLP